ncbi:MAG: helix-turn-helix domain-containing protein [Alphaproteobacteria bacterium]
MSGASGERHPAGNAPRTHAAGTGVGATVGPLIAWWRRDRRLSQLDLALEAGVSARHLSFVETGRAKPSRGLLLTLARTLDLSPRDRNGLLLAGGFAPALRETALDAPEMAETRAALGLILSRNEPFPAVVFDRGWDILMANAAYARVVNAALPAGAVAIQPGTLAAAPRPNLLRLLCDPAGYRPHIANWPHVARAVLMRERREMGLSGARGEALLRDLAAYPDVGAILAGLDADPAPFLVVPVELRTPAGIVRLLSTIATLGTAQDITLQEIRIETFHPADQATAALLGGAG